MKHIYNHTKEVLYNFPDVWFCFTDDPHCYLIALENSIIEAQDFEGRSPSDARGNYQAIWAFWLSVMATKRTQPCSSFCFSAG